MPSSSRRAPIPNRYDVLVVAGGDGTINEAVNGLRDARLPLAIVPLGTANVLAAEIGMATDPRTVARTIALGRPRPISVGVANGRRFLLMAGTGFDAHVVQHVDLAAQAADRQSRLWDRDPAPAGQLCLSRVRCDDRRQDLEGRLGPGRQCALLRRQVRLRAGGRPAHADPRGLPVREPRPAQRDRLRPGDARGPPAEAQELSDRRRRARSISAAAATSRCRATATSSAIST